MLRSTDRRKFAERSRSDPQLAASAGLPHRGKDRTRFVWTRRDGRGAERPGDVHPARAVEHAGAHPAVPDRVPQGLWIPDAASRRTQRPGFRGCLAVYSLFQSKRAECR